MERFSLTDCRKLIGQAGSSSLSDEDLLRLRDMLYIMGDVIADAYADLDNIDQGEFDPPNDLEKWFLQMGKI